MAMENPEIVLISPPAISSRYMETKFMPYGMSVLFAYLKSRGHRVSQHDFLMDYLYSPARTIDFHSPDRSFTNAPWGS